MPSSVTRPFFMRLCRAFSFPLILATLAAPLSAAPERKPPYWQSLRADEVNMRVGPGEDYTIRFVYHRKHLPVRVLRIKENWRLVEDPDGVRGWMVINFLGNERSATVKGRGPAEMRNGSSDSARLLWKIAPGAVGKLGNCTKGWCLLDIDRHVGWVQEERLWGVGEP
jgi:SH3-like domain-containing protein